MVASSEVGPYQLREWCPSRIPRTIAQQVFVEEVPRIAVSNKRGMDRRVVFLQTKEQLRHTSDTCCVIIIQSYT